MIKIELEKVVFGIYPIRLNVYGSNDTYDQILNIVVVRIMVHRRKEDNDMKKRLKKSIDREQRSMQLYYCSCEECLGCSGCSGTPSSNFNENYLARSASKSARNVYNDKT